MSARTLRVMSDLTSKEIKEEDSDDQSPNKHKKSSIEENKESIKKNKGTISILT